MTDSSLFWLGVLVYSLVLMLFLYMTRKEQTTNQVPWSGALLGFVGCILWPLTMAVVVLTVMLQRNEERRSG